ncbi:PAF1 [Auxenochlorella protothecoides x Auxenochlorella symbiontica]
MPAAPPSKVPTIRLSREPNRLTRETPFNCRIQFRNDLPEIPCDPKLLLPVVNARELAAFSLTTLEKGLKRDMLFEPDLGIPLAPLSIQRYAIPEGSVPLDPADAALLETGDTANGKKGKHASASEVSWLLRTSYLTSGHGADKGSQRPDSRASRGADAAADEELGEDVAARIATIEESFAAAELPPVHATKPELSAVEVLPVLPDDSLAGRNYVLALFDTDPVADIDRLSRLEQGQLSRVKQAVQLKSFAQRKSDGQLDRFVALLVPSGTLPAGPDSGALSARQLQGDYEWVREYDSSVRYDDKQSTFLFRRTHDRVGYHDLNTKLALRKRKRGALEGESFLQPEKIVLRLPEGAGADDVVGAPASGTGSDAVGVEAPGDETVHASDLGDVGTDA